MAIDGVIHHVFVDLENVPTVDLGLISDKPVHVTLVIGEKQKRLDLRLVRQIHQHAAKVTLIEVGASGHNALDLVLACHLGQTVVQHPGGQFLIVSKDKDFNPLVAHLRTDGMDVTRHEAFAALPFFNPVAKAVGSDERLEKLIDGLRHRTTARPVRRKTLLSHINAYFAKQLSPADLEAIVDTLEERQVIAIDANDKVSYP
ncbi:MAG: PIN domain-containing protein [Opitutaceae bacterium]|nr:PIN domain-containing protein [Opitutaceae bacterium]